MAGERSVKNSPVKRTAQSAEIAFQTLRKAILTGELKEGDKVREIRLARQWKIGRTPLREAIRRAAESGYLILRPNHAPIVRELSAADILQIYALRKVLECYALECAWNELRESDFESLRKLEGKVQTAKSGRSRLHAQFTFDNALHQLWVTKNGNPWLISIVERLLIFRPNYQSRDVNILAGRPDLTDAAFEDHQKILAALIQRDLPRALRALRRHISEAGTILAGLHPTGSAPKKS